MTAREINKLVRSGWPVLFNGESISEAKTFKGDTHVRVPAGWFMVTHEREVRAATSVAVGLSKGAL